MKWYRKYWKPWGYTIGYHDFTFLPEGVINRHFYKSGRVKHYCIEQYTENGRVVPFKRLRDCIQKLKEVKGFTRCT